jgi:hypothetical protein
MSDLEPRVCVDPRVYNNTAGVWVWCVPLPGVGVVSADTGAVLFSPTRTVPVRNPNCNWVREYCNWIVNGLGSVVIEL